MALQLILVQDVDHLGKAGEVVSVKNGYARNFLIPQGMAVIADVRSKTRLEAERKTIEKRVAAQRAEAGSLAERINAMTLQFERLVGEENKMFGSVTSRDIHKQLETAGVVIDHKKIEMPEAIRELGKYEVPVHLGADVTATLKFWVIGKEQE